jgi:hypothetical protein
MEWFLPYEWAAALGASTGPIPWWGPMPWWGGPGPQPREPVADEVCAGPTAIDLELVRVVYEVLVERVGCGLCGAPLHPAIAVEVTRGSFTAARIVVTAHCRGWRRHRHLAGVVERAGDLRFGQLGPS